MAKRATKKSSSKTIHSRLSNQPFRVVDRHQTPGHCLRLAQEHWATSGKKYECFASIFNELVLDGYLTDFDNFWCFVKLKVRIFWFSHFWKDPRGFWGNPMPIPRIQSTDFDHTVLHDYWTDFDFFCFGKLKVRIFWFSHFWNHLDSETTPCPGCNRPTPTRFSKHNT